MNPFRQLGAGIVAFNTLAGLAAFAASAYLILHLDSALGLFLAVGNVGMGCANLFIARMIYLNDRGR